MLGDNESVGEPGALGMARFERARAVAGEGAGRPDIVTPGRHVVAFERYLTERSNEVLSGDRLAGHRAVFATRCNRFPSCSGCLGTFETARQAWLRAATSVEIDGSNPASRSEGYRRVPC